STTLFRSARGRPGGATRAAPRSTDAGGSTRRTSHGIGRKIKSHGHANVHMRSAPGLVRHEAAQRDGEHSGAATRRELRSANEGRNDKRGLERVVSRDAARPIRRIGEQPAGPPAKRLSAAVPIEILEPAATNQPG